MVVNLNKAAFKVRTYFIDDFISNDPTALSVITDFKTNKLIVKGSTGIGGTSAILGITDQTIIIVSPLVSMIIDKESQNEKLNNLFIYKGSRNTWREVNDKISDDEKFILNTTPEQIMLLKKNDSTLFKKIRKIPLFIDESHLSAETGYRKFLAQFSHEVFYNWQNHFTLSTATPVYLNLDIPNHISETLEIIRIKRRKSSSKPITIYNYRHFVQWVRNEIAKGNKVVLFTNNKNIYKIFLQYDDIDIQTLVGKKLETEVVTFRDAERLNLSDKLEPNRDLYILSTSYLTGFDIPFPASVGIISNEMSPVDTRFTNDIVQAYGRLRSTVINAAIFYFRYPNREPFNESLIFKKIKDDLEYPTTDLLTDGKVNHTLVINKHLPEILRNQTYGSIESLANGLRNYGFEPSIDFIDEVSLAGFGLKLPDKISNLLSMEEYDLGKFTDYVFMNIDGDNSEYNGFNEKLIQLYACSYIAKMTDNQWLIDKLKTTDHYEDLIRIVKTFIDVNVAYKSEPIEFPEDTPEIIRMLKSDTPTPNELDELTKFHVSEKLQNAARKGGAFCKEFKNYDTIKNFKNACFLVNTFYVIYLVKNDKLDQSTLQKMEMDSELTSRLKEDYLSCISHISYKSIDEVKKLIEAGDESLDGMMINRPIKTYFRNTLARVITQLEKKFTPTAEQLITLKIKMDKHINSLSKSDHDLRSKLRHLDLSMERQKENHKNYLLGMASLHIAGHMAGFLNSHKHNREYNIATKVSKALRSYTPYRMVEVDISSANAQIIDRLFQSNIGLDVYTNLMDANGITRDEAKVLFNSTLNNYMLPKSKAKAIYLDAGYPEVVANAIAESTTSSKIYFKMCEAEKTIVLNYRAAIAAQNSIRIHDGFIMIATTHNTRNLLDIHDGIRFSIRYF